MTQLLNGTPDSCKQEGRGREWKGRKRKETFYMLIWKDLQDIKYKKQGAGK